MPRISIITPLSNGANYLSATLKSVVRQSFAEWETIIVDDGSTDASVNIAKTFIDSDARFRLVNQDGNGVAEARNQGFANCSPEAEFVVFLDHDDVWRPDALSRLLKVLEQEPNAVGSHGLARYIDDFGNPVESDGLEQSDRLRLSYQAGAIRPVPLEDPTTFECLIVRNYMTTPGAVLLRKSAMEKFMPFNTDCQPCEDWHLYARMSLHGPFAFLDTPVLDYRVKSANASRRKENLRQAEAKVRYELTVCPEVSIEQAEMAKSVYNTWQRYAIRKRLVSVKSSLHQGQVLKAMREMGSTVRPWINSMRGKP
ncbi:MAG: glycosyltransferase [Chthonomonadales bacterium]